MPKQQPKHVRKMVQHGSKFGPSWGHVGFQNRPGRVQGRKNAFQRPLEKRIRKSIEKPRSGRLPDGKCWGVGVVIDLLSGPTFQISRKQHLHLSKNFKTRSFKPSTYSKLEASSHQLKLLLHRRFHLEAPLEP